MFATKDAGCNKRISTLECDLYIFASEKILNCNTRFNKADELIDELENFLKEK
ncbi:MAG: hypothetical protein ACLS7Y_02970 [Thomasclavelia spiroformis]